LGEPRSQASGKVVRELGAASVSRSNHSDAPGAASRKSTGKMSPVEFMQIRSKMKDELTKVITIGKKKTATLGLIKAAAAKLSEAQLKLLEKQPDAMIACLEEVFTELLAIVDELEQFRLSGLEAMQTRISEICEKLDETDVKAQLELEAINFLNSEKSKDSRAEKNQNRYRRNTCMSRMVVGSYTKSLAKVVSARIEEPDELAAKSFDTSVPTLFLESTEWGKAMLDKIASFRSKQVATAEEKQQSTLKSLAAKPEWLGCLVKWEHDKHDFSDWGLGDLECESEPGSCPWTVAFRQNSWRYGPHAWPLPGVGSFVQNLADPVLDVYIIVIPLEEALTHGIAAKDLQAFLDTHSGKQLFHTEAKVVKLQTGASAAVWVPYGYVAVPLALTEPKSDGDSKEILQKVVHLWCWSPMSTSLASQVAEQVWTSIVSWNRAYMQKFPTQKTWSDRSRSFEAFVAKVGTAEKKG